MDAADNPKGNAEMQTLIDWDSPILVSKRRVIVGAESWDVVHKVLHVSEKLRLAATNSSTQNCRYRQALCQASHACSLDVGDKYCPPIEESYAYLAERSGML